MSQLQFSAKQYGAVFGSAPIECGSFYSTTDIELGEIFPMLIFSGITITTQQIRCNLYAKTGYKNLLYQSEWESLSNAFVGSNGRYYISCFFDRKNLKANQVCYVTFELQNYVKNGASHIALESNCIDPVYNTGTIITNSSYRFLVFDYGKPVYYG